MNPSSLRRPSVSALAVLVLALAVAACSGGGGDDGSPTSPGLTTAEVEFASFGLINDARTAEAALPSLELSQALSEVARGHSRAMRDEGFFGHVDGAGNRLRDRLNAAGLSFSLAAENLVQVNHRSNPAVVAHVLLMDSAEHRDNILDSRFQVAGVGVARLGDTYWITQIFVRP